MKVCACTKRYARRRACAGPSRAAATAHLGPSLRRWLARTTVSPIRSRPVNRKTVTTTHRLTAGTRVPSQLPDFTQSTIRPVYHACTCHATHCVFIFFFLTPLSCYNRTTRVLPEETRCQQTDKEKSFSKKSKSALYLSEGKVTPNFFFFF